MYANKSNQLGADGPAARDATELEGLINTLRDTLFDAHGHLRNVHLRVLPPTPQKGESATVTPVASTYAQRIQELIHAAEDLRALAGDLNGRI